MKNNEKILKLEESATLRINQTALNKMTAGEEVHHFGFGESPFPVPDIMQWELQKHTDKKSYLPGLGLPALREAIARFLKENFSYPLGYEHIAIGPGSKELLFDALNIIKGTLLLPSPSWVSYAPIANIVGKKIVYMQTSFDSFYKLTPEILKQAILDNQDDQYLLVLNSPSNPTGQSYDSSILEQIAKICREHHVYVLSDEIYALLHFKNTSEDQSNAIRGIMHYLPERTLITGGISKAFGAGGWRLGFLTSPPTTEGKEFSRCLKTMISETFSCVSTPIQYASIPAFQFGTEIQSYVSACTSILHKVNHYACRRFNSMGVHCHPAEGGFYLFPYFINYRHEIMKIGCRDASDWCDYLMGEGIAFLPGSDFGRPPEEYSVRAATVNFDGKLLLDNYHKSDFNEKFLTYIPQVVAGLDKLESILKSIKKDD